MPRILIVDDEPFNVDYLEQELEDLGYASLSAVNGIEALEIIRREKPDVILLDIMMPGMDGFQVLTEVKGDGSVRDIPVIVISALTDMDSVIRGIELGAEDFLPKPFDPVLLHARIRAGVEKKQWRDREKAYLAQIEEEKRRADQLLHVILPDAIISELKSTNHVKPRLYDNVAVAFTDVVGFTPYSENNQAKDVVENLQLLFIAYENLAAEFGLQKIKTIGDSFMVAGGLFDPLENPVLSTVQCGLRMIEKAGQLPTPWDVRVGLHFGPVMGGIVGQRQYLFDVWGDTVNTAQRIESYGASNVVNMSKEAWSEVSDYCHGDSLGIVDVKGKGQLEIMAARALVADGE